jgi:preprotein translocase subunit SecG
MMQYISGFCMAMLAIIAYLSFGRKLYRITGSVNAHGFTYPASFALSLCFTGTVMFVAGIFRLYNIATVILLLAAMYAVSFNELAEIIGEIKTALHNFKIKKTVGYIPMAALMLWWVYITLAAMTPPVYYDSLVYHLGVLQQYISFGGIKDIPGNIFSYFPQLMSMNWLFCLILSNELCVKLFQFFTAAMGVYAACELAGIYNGQRVVTALLLLTSPLFVLNATRISTEAPVMFFTVVLLLFAAGKKDDMLSTGDNVFMGAMLGAIISVKYTAVLTAVFFIVFLLYMIYKKRETYAGLTAALLIPVIIISPYLIRNYLYAGNPFYPFLTGIFHTSVNAADAAAYVANISKFGPGMNIIEFLKSPWTTAVTPAIFGGDATAGLLPAALVIIICGFARRMKIAAAFFIFYYITWYFFGPVLRFLLPAEAAGAVIVSAVYTKARGQLKVIIITILIIIQSAVSVYFVEKYLKPEELFIRSGDAYISSRTTYYKAAIFINGYDVNKRPVVLLGEARCFYFNVPVEAYTVFNSRKIIMGFEEDFGANFMKQFAAQKAGYVMINRTETARLKNAGFGDVYAVYSTQVFKNIMDKYFKKLYIDNDCEIYEYKG